MTEIPEHLLKRSKERRAAIGGEDAPASEPAAAGAAVEPAASAAAEAPAAAAPAAAVEPAPEPPKPVRPEVAAALRRRKIPVWALPVLAFLPLWAYVYQATLEPPPAGDDTPFAHGQALYSGCQSCHGASGGGASGPALTGVLETFPDYRDHMAWVRIGSTDWPSDTYGANGQERAPGMPPHRSMSDAELAQVVLYERVAFGGMAEDDEQYLELVEVAEGHKTFEEVGLGDNSVESGVTPELVAGP